MAFVHAVVDVDGGEKQGPVLHHFVQTMHAGRGFFRHSVAFFSDFVPTLAVLLEAPCQRLQNFLVLNIVCRFRAGYRSGLFKLHATVNEHRGVATIIDNLMGT